MLFLINKNFSFFTTFQNIHFPIDVDLPIKLKRIFSFLIGVPNFYCLLLVSRICNEIWWLVLKSNIYRFSNRFDVSNSTSSAVILKID